MSEIELKIDLSNIDAFNCIPSEDKRTVSIKLGAEERTLNAIELEGLLARLGTIRSQLQPAVPIAAVEGYPAHELDGVLLYCENAGQVPARDGATLAARCAKFGYFLFKFTPE